MRVDNRLQNKKIGEACKSREVCKENEGDA